MVGLSEQTHDLPGRGTLASRGGRAKTATTGELPRVPDPPWKQAKQCQAFAGDVAAAELRNRLALAPDRLPDPPVATSSKSALAGRFIAVVLMAAAGLVGYWWGTARTSQLPSSQADLASKQLVSADLDSRGFDSQSPAARPLPNATPAVYPPDRSVSLVPPGPDRPLAARTDTRDAAASSPRESVESAASLPQEPAPALPPEDRDQALRLKQKGDDQLALGLVAPARLLYERAADLGLAEAALALAATYDETAAAHANLRGIATDPKAAAHWYERARLLAARDPDRQVQILGRN
jgi:hypothetical protein